MSRKATPSQAIDALNAIKETANDRQIKAIEVLESYIFLGHGLNRKLLESEKKVSDLELKIKELTNA